MNMIIRWIVWKMFGSHYNRWGQGNHIVATDGVVYRCPNGHHAEGYLQYHTFDSVTLKETPLVMKSCFQCGRNVEVAK